MKLHEAIVNVLVANGSPMTTEAIADALNANGWYVKKDGTAITPFQIHGRTKSKTYQHLFTRKGSLVMLCETISDKSIEPNLAINTKTIFKGESPAFNKAKEVTFAFSTPIKSSLEPIIDKNCTVLILGSMPGDESLLKNQYYANPKNGFWKIMNEIFDSMPQEYDERKLWLLKNKIGLWDVIKEAERTGSLDMNIENETINDFEGLFRQYPRIKRVCFNGTKAYQSFLATLRFNSQIIYVVLPSSSSARTIPFVEKIREWKNAML